MPMASTVHATASVRNSHLSLPEGFWVLRSLLAVTFLTMGVLNLWGTQSTVELFDQIGLGQWLRYFTGSLQLLGGVFVLIPLLSGIGSFILTVVMVGATLFVAVGAPGNSLLAILLLISASASFVQTQVW